jgi:hypothetical protein
MELTLRLTLLLIFFILVRPLQARQIDVTKERKRRELSILIGLLGLIAILLRLMRSV